MYNITKLFFSTIIFVICCVYSINTIAQNQEKVDSLYKVLALTKQDSSKVKLYLELGKLMTNINLDTSIILSKSALSICKRHNLTPDSLLYKALTIKSLNQIAAACFYMENLQEALTLYEKALSISSTLSDKYFYAIMLNNIANIYFRQGNEPKALAFYLKSLKVQNQIASTQEIANKLNNIGTVSNVAMVYYHMEDFTNALKYYKEALKTNMQMHNKTEIARSLNMIGLMNAHLGQLDTALKYQLQVSTFVNELEASKSFAINHLLAFGAVLSKMNRFDDAIKKYEKALSMSNLIGAKQSEVTALKDLSDCYYKKKDLNKALDYAQQTLALCKSSGIVMDKMYTLAIVADIYENKGDYKKAYQFQKEYYALNDSIIGLEAKKQVNELQEEYQAEKKENEIKLLTGEKEIAASKIRFRNLTIAGTIILAIALFLLYSRYNIKRQLETAKQKFAIEKQLIEVEQKALLLQMNPHFIFNSLSSIGSLIYENKPQVAIKYLTRFSKLMRLVLEYSLELLIPLEKELELLECYLELEKFRFEDKFSYSIHRDSLVVENVSIPPMLIQPHLENAIVHGIKNKSTMGKLDIYMCMEKNILVCEITDDGIGREKADLFKKGDTNNKRNSTNISKERLDLISKKNNESFKLIIEDLKDNQGSALGTKVILQIPASFI